MGKRKPKLRLWLRFQSIYSALFGKQSIVLSLKLGKGNCVSLASYNQSALPPHQVSSALEAFIKTIFSKIILKLGIISQNIFRFLNFYSFQVNFEENEYLYCSMHRAHQYFSKRSVALKINSANII